MSTHNDEASRKFSARSTQSSGAYVSGLCLFSLTGVDIFAWSPFPGGSRTGGFYRRKRAQLGPQQAIVATAHKIARTVYFMLKNKVQYHDIGAQAYEAQQRERELACLKRKAAKLGYQLAPKESALALVNVATVSRSRC
jgi:hypothetical protein